MSIGYDLNNASSVFRKTGLPKADLQKFASLVEEPEAVRVVAQVCSKASRLAAIEARSC